MYAPTISAYAARAYDLCDALHSRIEDVNLCQALLAAMVDLAQSGPPEASPLITGLIDQAQSLGKIAQYHVGQQSNEADLSGASKRSVIALKSSLYNLHVAVTAAEGE